MDNIINDIINETFSSKKQQRYFYAKVNDKTLSKEERKKWRKMAREFSSKTNFKKIPEKVDEKDIDEIVDANGDIARGSEPSNKNGYIRSAKTTDDVVMATMGQMGSFGILGGASGGSKTLKYWAESDMSKALGSDETIKDPNTDYEDAIDHFEDELGVPEDEAKERVKKMGYDPELPGNKIRLIENPKKYIEEYLTKKQKDNDIVTKSDIEVLSNKVNPIVKRQLKSLSQTIKKNRIDISTVLKYLKENE